MTFSNNKVYGSSGTWQVASGTNGVSPPQAFNLEESLGRSRTLTPHEFRLDPRNYYGELPSVPPMQNRRRSYSPGRFSSGQRPSTPPPPSLGTPQFFRPSTPPLPRQKTPPLPNSQQSQLPRKPVDPLSALYPDFDAEKRKRLAEMIALGNKLNAQDAEARRRGEPVPADLPRSPNEPPPLLRQSHRRASLTNATRTTSLSSPPPSTSFNMPPRRPGAPGPIPKLSAADRARLTSFQLSQMGRSEPADGVHLPPLDSVIPLPAGFQSEKGPAADARRESTLGVFGSLYPPGCVVGGGQPSNRPVSASMPYLGRPFVTESDPARTASRVDNPEPSRLERYRH